MSETKPHEKTIPYFTHEVEMFRAERMIKRMWISLLVSMVILVGSNAAWIYAERGRNE